MSQGDELRRFIETAKSKGVSDDAIAALLEAAGWSKKEIYAGLQKHYEAIIGMPVPARGGFGEGAQDAFFHLLAFGTLATWAVALGSILFALIEHAFPDPVVSREYAPQRGVLAGHLASLLVAFPVYLLVTRKILREVSESPEKKDSGIRKWLTWLALLIAASLVIGDVITILAWLLRGEITLRFLLKAVVILVLAGSIFWFYLRGLRERGPAPRLFAIAAGTAVIATLVAGFSVMGAPSVQRNIEADRRRIEHFKEIAGLLHARTELPEYLSQLPVRWLDPVSGRGYEYRKLSQYEYELCAIFTASDAKLQFWSHGSGRQCFRLNSRRSVPY